MKLAHIMPFGLVFLSLTAFAWDHCDFNNYIINGNSKVEEKPMKEDGTCNLSLVSMNYVKSHRNYLFKADGMIQISDTYGNIKGNDKITTGTRTFFVFPRHGDPQVDIRTIPDPDSGTTQVTEIKLSSGDKILFSAGHMRTPVSPPQLSSIIPSRTGLVISENPVISPATEGGVKIAPGPNSKSLVLDVGYTRGPHPAYFNPTLSSTFIDSNGKTCKVSNSVLFNKEAGMTPNLILVMPDCLRT